MTEESMRALVVTSNGGADVLAVQERPVPSPGPGEVLIRVEASGVNFKDVYEREGIYPNSPPFVLGDECAGVVEAIGPDVSDLTVGDAVATSAAVGAHAQYTLAKAATVVRLPHGVGSEQAAAALLQGMTAHYLMHDTYPVQAGDTVLVHAAAGGVGQWLVFLGKRLSATVIATVGSDAKVRIATDLGADHVIRYDEVDDLAAAVREHAADGVHTVFDGVGKATFEASLASLRRRGTLALFGASSGQVPPFDLQRLNPLGSLFVTRPTLADYVATPEDLEQRASGVFDLLRDGMQVTIGGSYRLDQAAEAYGALEGRSSTGKLVFTPDA